MGDFTAIAATSRTLRELLERDITGDTHPQLNGVPVDLRSPRELRDGNVRTAVSVWLYLVARNAETLNRPETRLPPDRLQRRPMPLELHYLITPLAVDPRDEQALMGRVVQILHDHAIVRGADIPLDAAGDLPAELRVSLESLTLEELTRVWAALGADYQLSLSYHVQLVEVDSRREPVRATPAMLRDPEVVHIVG